MVIYCMIKTAELLLSYFPLYTHTYMHTNNKLVLNEPHYLNKLADL